MRTTTSAAARDANATTSTNRLYMSLELSLTTWKLGFTDGRAEPRVVSILARGYSALGDAIAKARKRFSLASDARVVSCYEAGREGFSVHRRLEEMGIDNRVVNPASIRVARKARQSKTDRLDAVMLVKQLAAGELQALAVPSREVEDARQVTRELHELKVERGALANRIRGLLFAQGYDQEVSTRAGRAELELGRTDGTIKLLPHLSQRITRELALLEKVESQISEIEKARVTALKAAATRSHEQMRTLMTLCGIGIESAWTLVLELFGWRTFANRKKLAAFLGLTPTPFASGKMNREQGISKAGPVRLRSIMIELAWFWLRYQPDSDLSKWFNERFRGGTARTRRVGIVALARKLLISLWHFLDDGKPPAGASIRSDRYAIKPKSRRKSATLAA